MGEKDITEKLLEDHEDVFADIVNVLLFNGREVVKPKSLVSSGVRSQYKADDRKTHQQERDVAKYWKDGNVRIALYGIENQTNVDSLMPVRVIGYDGASYKSQITSKRKNILPVITLVLYFGKDHWNGPINLKDTLKIPEVVEKYVNDYRIHVFEIAWLSDEQIRTFKSDFRLVADFFVKRRTVPDYIPEDKIKIDHIEEMLKLLSALTGDNRYEDVLEDAENEEVNTMCDVAERLTNMGRIKGLAEGRAEGRAEGKADTLYSLVQDGDLSLEKAAEKMQVSSQEFEKLMVEAGYKLPATV